MRLLQNAAQLLAVFGLVCLTGVSLGVVVDVGLRALFGAPIDGLAEVMSLVAAITISSFLPLSMLMRSHVSLRFLNALVGPRTSWLMEQFAALVTLVFMSLISWQLVRHAQELLAVGERTWILQMTTGPWWVVVAVVFALSSVAQLGVLLSGLFASAPIAKSP